MHRLTAVLVSLFLANAVFAGLNESDPRVKNPTERFGRAMVLTAHQALSDADIAELASRGVAVKRALPGGRYLARVKDEAAAENDARIASVEPMTSRLKLHPSVLREAALAKPYTRVNVVFYNDVDFDAARDAILDAGGELDDPFRLKFAPSRRLTARVAPVALQALVDDERVMTIAGPTRKKPRTDNSVSAIVSRVDVVQAAPYGLTGEGVTVSLFELAEAQASHIEFGGRLTTHALGGSVDDKSHATHVAGTIAAAGVNTFAKGMAPKAQIHEYCLPVDGLNQCEGDFLELKDQELEPLGITADNNSWGYELGWYSEGGFPVWDGSEIFFGSYQQEFGGPIIDEISIGRKVLFVHSAGNNGNSGGFSTEFSQHRHVDENFDTITTEFFCYSKNDSGTDCPALCNGTNLENGAAVGCERFAERHHEQIPFDTLGVVASAKNVIAVGAVSGGVPETVSIASLSSRGPAKDGRIKPDVVSRGVNLLSPVPTDGYSRKQGTSMAAPVVTGIAVLLTEQWRKTFAGASPLPEQLKALILAGADDLGNPGPDYTYGFGLVNAKTSVDLIRDDGGTGARIQTTTFPNGALKVTREFPLVVTQPQNLRVLLNWADPPGEQLADYEVTDPTLVNDLDLKVMDAVGNTYLPYVLDKVAYTANATRGVNKVDNTEEVEIANAPAGNYRVLVTGTSVAEGPQTAVIVANAALGALLPPPCIDLIENLGANNTPATAFGNLATGQQISAGLCTQGDLDHYKFVASKAGPVGVTITSGDTPLRATLTATGVNITVDVPANSQGAINAFATTVPLAFVLKFEANGALGAQPHYSFTTQFGETHQPRRRAAGG